MSIGSFDTQNITRQTSLAMWITFAIMAMLLIWCFMIPPRGENAEEILKGCVLLYAVIPSAIVREALKEGKGAKLTHGDMHVEISGTSSDSKSDIQ